MTDRSVQDNDTSKKFTSLDVKKLKRIFDIFLQFFKDKNNSGKVILSLAVLGVAALIYCLFSLYGLMQTLHQKTPDLVKLNVYDTSSFATHRMTKEALNFSSTLGDLVNKDVALQSDIQKYTDYRNNLQLPYQNFLQYVYLPGLNIWKDAYTQQIDTGLVGAKFLHNNPYNDVALLQKRSDFFKNVGDNNEFNEVSDISVDAIHETSDWFFYIPVTVSFTANSKRSFLLLIDKLSATSNRENIALINEFFYQLWQEIKIQKKSELDSLVALYSPVLWSWLSVDRYIGYALYSWIFKDWENTLIDQTILENTIKKLMMCNDIEMTQCYYQFREKYRDVATFAYALSKDVSTDTVANFKNFFASFPPILAIKDFTFDKIKSSDLNDFTHMKYQGKITIDVYGRGIPQGDIDQMASTLWNLCFRDNKMISVEDASNLVHQAIVQQSDAAGTDRSKSQDLVDLASVFDGIVAEYSTLSNYKKIVRLFEVWRMLEDNGLCQL